MYLTAGHCTLSVHPISHIYARIYHGIQLAAGDMTLWGWKPTLTLMPPPHIYLRSNLLHLLVQGGAVSAASSRLLYGVIRGRPFRPVPHILNDIDWLSNTGLFLSKCYNIITYKTFSLPEPHYFRSFLLPSPTPRRNRPCTQKVLKTMVLVWNPFNLLHHLNETNSIWKHDSH